MIFLEVILFIVGMQLMIQSLAACYGIVDFWHAFSSHWMKVLTGIVVNLGLVGLLLALLPADLASAFSAGLLTYLLFHVLIFVLFRLLLLLTR